MINFVHLNVRTMGPEYVDGCKLCKVILTIYMDRLEGILLIILPITFSMQ